MFQAGTKSGKSIHAMRLNRPPAVSKGNDLLTGYLLRAPATLQAIFQKI